MTEPDPSTRSRAVLFDLDGTLVDSFPGIAAAYHATLEELGLGDRDDAEIAAFIGPPIQVVLAEHFGLRGTRLDQGVQFFRRHYGGSGLLRFSAYPGVDTMLGALRDEGLRLCIATSKLRSMALEVVGHAGWADTFDVVGGAHPGGTPSRKREVIEWTLGHLPPGTEVTAMVGDRADDIVGGRDLGVPGIGVTWGYGSADELVAAGAVAVVDSPHDLVTCLTAHPVASTRRPR